MPSNQFESFQTNQKTQTLLNVLMQPKICCLLILGTLCSCLMFHTLALHDDNIQILHKAYLLVFENVWTHYGNRATAVGYLPGSLTTALTALPMKAYLSPYASAVVIIFFHFLSLLILLNVGMVFDPQKKTCFF